MRRAIKAPPAPEPNTPNPATTGLSGTLYLIRHGKTALNKGADSEDRIRGWVNVPLTTDGRREALATGESLLQSPIQAVICSDLERAVETAQIIAREIGAPPPQPTWELRPWNLGTFQGQATKSVLKELMFYVEHPSQRVPEGESFDEFRLRALGALQPILQQVHQGATLAIVTHFRDYKLFQAWVAAGCPEDLSYDPDTFMLDDAPTGSFATMTWNGQTWVLEQPEQPGIDDTPKIPPIADSPEKRQDLGSKFRFLIQDGLRGKGSAVNWWETCMAWHRNEMSEASAPGDVSGDNGLVPMHIPFLQPRVDMLTAMVCGVIGKQVPYMLCDDAAGNSDVEDAKERTLQRFWKRAGFERQIRKASNIVVDANLVWFRVAWERSDAKPFSGLSLDVIPPNDITISPATSKGIPGARLVGHRFWLRRRQVADLQKSGTYFNDTEVHGGDDVRQVDTTGEIDDSGANPSPAGQDPGDQLVEMFQFIVQYSDDPAIAESAYVGTIALTQGVLLALDVYPYSRPWYFDSMYIVQTNNAYYPAVSVSRHLSALQDCTDKLASQVYNISQIAAFPPIIGQELDEKDKRYTSGQMISSDSPAQPWSPTVRADTSPIVGFIQYIAMIGDQVARISANTMGSIQSRTTTATENSIVASGVATGVEEYIANFSEPLPDMADFTMELLASHFPDWERDAATIGVMREQILSPAAWDVNGQTPGNTPGAKLAALNTIMQAFAQFGPQTGIDLWEMVHLIVINAGLGGADNLQTAKNMWQQAQKQAQDQQNQQMQMQQQVQQTQLQMAVQEHQLKMMQGQADIEKTQAASQQMLAQAHLSVSQAGQQPGGDRQPPGGIPPIAIGAAGPPDDQGPIPNGALHPADVAAALTALFSNPSSLPQGGQQQ